MRMSYWFPSVLYGSGAIVMSLWALVQGQVSWPRAIPLWITGLIVWTFLEYVLHRFPLHAATEKEPLKSLTAAHLLHHKLPKDHLVTLLIASLPAAILVLGILRLLIGNWSDTALMGTGLLIGYAWYEWIHAQIHIKPARTRIGKYLQRHHLIHHERGKDCYGITTPVWDWVFQTMPSVSQQSTQRSFKNLP